MSFKAPLTGHLKPATKDTHAFLDRSLGVARHWLVQAAKAADRLGNAKAHERIHTALAAIDDAREAM